MSATVAALFTEGHRLDFIWPASRSAAEATTGYLSMRDFHKLTVIVMAGAIGALGTVDCKVVQAQDDAGTGVKDISGKAITPLDEGDDNSAAVIEVDTSEMDATNNFDYINVILSTGGNVACLTNVLVVRHQPRFSPVDDTNLDEVVA